MQSSARYVHCVFNTTRSESVAMAIDARTTDRPTARLPDRPRRVQVQAIYCLCTIFERHWCWSNGIIWRLSLLAARWLQITCLDFCCHSNSYATRRVPCPGITFFRWLQTARVGGMCLIALSVTNLRYNIWSRWPRLFRRESTPCHGLHTSKIVLYLVH